MGAILKESVFCSCGIKIAVREKTKIEIKVGKRTITSKSIFSLMFILVLIATIVQMVINMHSDGSLITGMVIFSACVTGLSYYLSKESN
jgi:hypothetical protein